MSLNKDDVWADLRYAFDELHRAPRRLSDSPNLDEQTGDEFLDRLPTVGPFAREHHMAEMRADTRNAHEAIERGLKAILLDGGLPLAQVRQRGHELHLLLADVKSHNPTAFRELERCFDSTIEYLEIVTTREYVRHYKTDILDYFQKHGKAEVFVTNRYMSLEGDKHQYGMIGHISFEIIRALMALIFGGTPKYILSRIEEGAREAVLAESRRDPAWDEAEWLSQGSVRSRLEDVEKLRENRVLRLAVRRCARESKDRGIRDWARGFRHKHFAARRKARDERRIGSK